MQIRMIGIVKISYILHAWILTSIAFPSAQKVSSVKTLYAGPPQSTNILKLLALNYYRYDNES